MRYFSLAEYQRRHKALQKQVDEIVANDKGTDAVVGTALFDAVEAMFHGNEVPVGMPLDGYIWHEIAASRKRLGIGEENSR